MAEAPTTLLGKAKFLTNWYDGELAEIVGLHRATVQAVIGGRLKENLSEAQKAALLEALQSYRDTVTRGVAEVELMC
jgi:uncharacterized protein YbgA (DUF1722 family)